MEGGLVVTRPLDHRVRLTGVCVRLSCCGTGYGFIFIVPTSRLQSPGLVDLVRESPLVSKCLDTKPWETMVWGRPACELGNCVLGANKRAGHNT